MPISLEDIEKEIKMIKGVTKVAQDDTKGHVSFTYKNTPFFASPSTNRWRRNEFDIKTKRGARLKIGWGQPKDTLDKYISKLKSNSSVQTKTKTLVYEEIKKALKDKNIRSFRQSHHLCADTDNGPEILMFFNTTSMIFTIKMGYLNYGIRMLVHEGNLADPTFDYVEVAVAACELLKNPQEILRQALEDKLCQKKNEQKQTN